MTPVIRGSTGAGVGEGEALGRPLGEGSAGMRLLGSGSGCCDGRIADGDGSTKTSSAVSRATSVA